MWKGNYTGDYGGNKMNKKHLLAFMLEVIVLVFLIMASGVIGYYGAQAKVLLYGDMYHNPVYNQSELLMTASGIGACAGIGLWILYGLIYNRIENRLRYSNKDYINSRGRNVREIKWW